MLKKLFRQISPVDSPSSLEPKYRLALDIGTEYVKAVYIEIGPEGAIIRGVGRSRQEYGDMEGGAVANIPGVVNCCRLAMEQGAAMAEVEPREVVIGLAGQLVTGVARTIEKQRPRPNRPITKRELENLVRDAQKQTLQSLEKEMAARLGFSQIDLELVNSAVVGISIDGYHVANPLDFRGRNLEISLFMTFVPLVHASAMRTIASHLQLELVGLVAEPYAVAVSMLDDEAYEFGSLVIDIGGGSTDIALIQRRGIVATKMLAMGGRAFTKGIAAAFRTSLRDAERMKLDYAEGIGHEEVKDSIQSDLSIWLDAVILALQEIYQGAPFPPRVVLCGGGSGLPGIVQALQGDRLVESGLFAEIPQVTLLAPKDIKGIADPKEYLTGTKDVTPKSIASQSVILKGDLDALLGGAHQG